MKTGLKSVLLAATAVFVFSLVAASGAHAQTSESACEVQSASDAVVILVCKPGTEQASLKRAGEEACADRVGVCNVWVWDDPDLAPEEAPASDAGLDKADVRQAVAVWVNDSSRLIILKRATT